MKTRRVIYKSGWREDLGVKVRSGWEAAILRCLNYQDVEWEYEPERFQFPIKHGTISYTPDIYLPELDVWIEIKGAITASDKTKIKRFKKYYPEEFAKLVAIVRSPTTDSAKFFNEIGVPIMAYYVNLEKTFKPLIPKWAD